jgi:hypothetical protein
VAVVTFAAAARPVRSGDFEGPVRAVRMLVDVVALARWR